MQGDDEEPLAGIEPPGVGQPGPVEARQGEDAVEPRRADHMHPLGRLAHLADPAGVVLGGGEVQGGHFGDRVADGVVESPFGQFAAVDVADRNAEQQRRLHRGEDFVAVAEHHHGIGPLGREGLGKPGHSPAQRGGQRGAVPGTGQAEVDANGDRVRPGLDLAHRQAVRLGQVGPGHRQAQAHARMGGHGVEHRHQQAVLGARAGDHADRFRFGSGRAHAERLIPRLGPLGKQTVRAVSSSVTARASRGQSLYIGR